MENAFGRVNETKKCYTFFVFFNTPAYVNNDDNTINFHGEMCAAETGCKTRD